MLPVGIKYSVLDLICALYVFTSGE